MGQQISGAGEQNLHAALEHEAISSVAEVNCGYLSSHVERFIKLAQSSLAPRVYDWYRSSQNTNIRQQLLQEDSSMISCPVAATAQDAVPTHFTDISLVDLSFDGDEYDMGVAAVLREPVGLYCHVPVRKVCKVDSCNTACQTDDECQHNTSKVNKGFDNLLETSHATSEVLNCTNDQVIVNENNVTASTDEIFLSGHEPRTNAKIRFHDAECQCRSRPPPSPKLITSPAAVLQSAHESRPPEIGSYLTVAPMVSSCDLGLSPIDETAEVAPTTSLFSQANVYNTDDTSKLNMSNLLSYHSSLENISSGSDHTRYSVFIVHKSEVSCPENSVVSSLYDDTDFIHKPLKAETTLSQSDESFAKARGSIDPEMLRTVDDILDDRKFCEDTCTGACFSTLESGLDEVDKCARTCIRNSTQLLEIPATMHHRSQVDMSTFDPVSIEWETALPCLDWSANNNESSSPGAAHRNMSPAAGPLIARRQVRHSSDSSAPLSSSLPSAAECPLNPGSQYQPLPARSMSQLSLDDVIVSPRTVPERLDFQQLEKFEGGF